MWGFPGGVSGKDPTCQCRKTIRDTSSVPRSGRSLGGGHGNPLQYSCLENSCGQRSLASCSPQGRRVRRGWVTKRTHTVTKQQSPNTITVILTFKIFIEYRKTTIYARVKAGLINLVLTNAICDHLKTLVSLRTILFFTFVVKLVN